LKVKLSIWKRLSLRIRGYAFIGNYIRPGWKGALPHYVVVCHKHGLYVDYPHGFDGYFLCPKCWKEQMGDKVV
jgi:hypothetical protein